MTSNRWFEVYITDGLDKYYEKSTILGIYILTLKIRGGGSLLPAMYVYTLPHTSERIWTLVQVDIYLII